MFARKPKLRNLLAQDHIFLYSEQANQFLESLQGFKKVGSFAHTGTKHARQEVGNVRRPGMAYDYAVVVSERGHLPSIGILGSDHSMHLACT